MFVVLLGPNHTHPEKPVLSMFSPHFRGRMDLPKTFHSESGLNQRDRATAGFSREHSHGKPSKIFFCRGFAGGIRRANPARSCLFCSVYLVLNRGDPGGSRLDKELDRARESGSLGVQDQVVYDLQQHHKDLELMKPPHSSARTSPATARSRSSVGGPTRPHARAVGGVGCSV